MTPRPRIGVLGGYGAVGRLLLERLHADGMGTLVVGGRRPQAAVALIEDRLAGAAEFAMVDLDDTAALSRFCAGCDVVVNCAGPSHRILDRVAREAIAAGACYVDVGGDDPAYRRLAESGWSGQGNGGTMAGPVPTGRRVVFSAGMLPGLSGLLPRYLATQGFDEVERLMVYHGIRDRFSLAAAIDYVIGILDRGNQPLAGWRDGRPQPRALRRRTDLALPFFAEPVTAHPYLSPEAERTAKALGLREASWYTVLDGEHLPTVLDQLPGTAYSEVDSIAARLQVAAELDVLGRTRHATMLFQLEGKAGGRPQTRSLVLRGATAAGLVAAVGWLAVVAVLRHEAAPGVHFAADVLDSRRTVEVLAADPNIAELSVFDGALAQLTVLEEGAI